MLVKKLKTNKPSVYIAFFVFAVFFLITNIIFDNQPSIEHNHPIFSFFGNFFIRNHIFSNVLLFVISLLIAMGWNNALSERGVFKNITIIPAFLFIIFSSVFTLSSIWICVFILLFILNKLMLCFQNEKPYSLLFDCGFLIGLATIINPICIFFLTIIYVAIIVYSNITWRNLIIPFLGLILPFFFTGVYVFLFNKLDSLSNYYLHSLTFSYTPFNYSVPLLVWSIFILVLLLLSLNELSHWISMKSLRSRKAFYIFFSYSVCAFLGFFFSQNSWDYLLFFTLPFTVLVSNYFIFIKKEWWSECLFILIVICTIYFQLSTLFNR